MRILDLFCGAGGASKGYYLGGATDIVGIDNMPQPRYPYQFIQEDALRYLKTYGRDFDFIHASPPCQRYSRLRHAAGRKESDYPHYVDITREYLEETGVPYVIENVMPAPLLDPIVLCGTMFGLRLFRHRKFETNFHIKAPIHIPHKKQGLRAPRTGRPPKEGEVWSIYGHFAGVAGARVAMECEWMLGRELAQAIPPRYTKYILEWYLNNGQYIRSYDE